MSSALTSPDLWALAARAKQLAADFAAAYPYLRTITAVDQRMRRVLYQLDVGGEGVRQAAEALTEMAEDVARQRHRVLSYIWQDCRLSGAELSELERDAARLNLPSWKAWLQHRRTCAVCRAAVDTHGLGAGEPGPIQRYPERARVLTAALCETGRKLRAAEHGGNGMSDRRPAPNPDDLWHALTDAVAAEPWVSEAASPDDCWWCGNNRDEGHRADCAWVRGRAVLRGFKLQ